MSFVLHLHIKIDGHVGWIIKYDLAQNKIQIFMYLHLITYFPNLPTYFSTYLPT
jgi:hypothetical protein